MIELLNRTLENNMILQVALSGIGTTLLFALIGWFFQQRKMNKSKKNYRGQTMDFQTLYNKLNTLTEPEFQNLLATLVPVEKRNLLERGQGGVVDRGSFVRSMQIWNMERELYDYLYEGPKN